MALARALKSSSRASGCGQQRQRLLQEMVQGGLVHGVAVLRTNLLYNIVKKVLCPTLPQAAKEPEADSFFDEAKANTPCKSTTGGFV